MFQEMKVINFLFRHFFTLHIEIIYLSGQLEIGSLIDVDGHKVFSTDYQQLSKLRWRKTVMMRNEKKSKKKGTIFFIIFPFKIVHLTCSKSSLVFCCCCCCPPHDGLPFNLYSHSLYNSFIYHFIWSNRPFNWISLMRLRNYKSAFILLPFFTSLSIKCYYLSWPMWFPLPPELATISLSLNRQVQYNCTSNYQRDCRVREKNCLVYIFVS